MVPSAETPTQIQPTAPAPPAPTSTPGLTPHEPPPHTGGPGGPLDPPKRPTGGGGNGGNDGSGPNGPGDDAARKRLTLIVAGVGIVVLIVLFIALQSSSNDDGTTASTPSNLPVATQSQAKAAAAATNPTEPVVSDPSLPKASTPSSTPEATSPDGGGVAVGGQTTPAAEDQTADAGPTLSSGSVTKIKVKVGDTVRFQVESDTPQEIHVHGYDKKYEIEGGATLPISFKATIDGIFDIEFEDTGTQIGELTVEP